MSDGIETVLEMRRSWWRTTSISLPLTWLLCARWLSATYEEGLGAAQALDSTPPRTSEEVEELLRELVHAPAEAGRQEHGESERRRAFLRWARSAARPTPTRTSPTFSRS